jgi:hypothetical protein
MQRSALFQIHEMLNSFYLLGESHTGTVCYSNLLMTDKPCARDTEQYFHVFGAVDFIFIIFLTQTASGS